MKSPKYEKQNIAKQNFLFIRDFLAINEPISQIESLLSAQNLDFSGWKVVLI